MIDGKRATKSFTEGVLSVLIVLTIDMVLAISR